MNKTIIIDNEEFELVPVNKYKVNDWIIYIDRVRKIVSSADYADSNGGSTSLNEKYGDWMTVDAAKQYKKDIKGKATAAEIKEHLVSLAIKKGLVKGAAIRSIYRSKYEEAPTDIYEYDSKNDELILTNNLSYPMIIYSCGVWAEVMEQPKFTFGGYPVTFDVINTFSGKGNKEVTITCKGQTGKSGELANIITHFFRPMVFGSVYVKGWTMKDEYDTKVNIPSFYASEDRRYVDTVTIGCLTGKYSELVEIYKHSQEILKNWKPAKGFDK